MSDMSERMREWMAKNGAKYVAEGFYGYLEEQVPTPAPAREVVPQVDDDEVVEAELLTPLEKDEDTKDDIVEAEIVET